MSIFQTDIISHTNHQAIITLAQLFNRDNSETHCSSSEGGIKTVQTMPPTYHQPLRHIRKSPSKIPPMSNEEFQHILSKVKSSYIPKSNTNPSQYKSTSFINTHTRF